MSHPVALFIRAHALELVAIVVAAAFIVAGVAAAQDVLAFDWPAAAGAPQPDSSIVLPR